MRKILSVVLAIIIFLDVVAISVLFIDRKKSDPAIDEKYGYGINANQNNGAEGNEEPSELFTRVTFTAVGDNLIHDAIYEQAAARTSSGYDFEYAYQNISDKIEAKDVAILNQETIISTDHNVSSYPQFNSPTELGEEMLDIGFDVFNIATNHSIDCGEKGLISAIEFWKSKNAVTTGAYLNEADFQTIPVTEVKGIKIAYVGFTEQTNGLKLPSDTDVILMTTNDEERLIQRVRDADAIADFVIVNAHWGVEYTHEPNDTQRNLAKKLGENGADVIIGTHPHVIQPVEFISNSDGSQTLVAYSLGNFISAQNRGPRMLGGMLNFELVKNNTTGEFTVENVTFEGVVTHYGYDYSNIRVYPLESYTDELASKHGVLSKTSSFSRKYLDDILEDVIDDQFLVKN
ncbi:MAG: CapA family protein [Clostridia bacterium]|nr:CapA family protein [Clostridia bacterium]